ncbi:Glyoxalase/bleomycin resistance protein/dioxygenase [Solidesulfovibrio fructosivorans JJ]]|uniref:Glyoxalase/bleomycin resistance protein/dioxygenase n=1 Tax=Solidesulfovibrio fructosivorans JJ] TaxID=596151 RepID=E1JVG2_SOLFR|nr:VOC family protein [Solidesulfovibrio fructosivorans]EFL51756.1 Glyoxalase/bleomycin resistance protein/dioxygenase [Solidesulfovibrio fructosivorans JJ]]
MPVTRAAPKLMVEDVARSVAFYRDVLGFEFVCGVTEDTRQVVDRPPASGRLALAEVKSGQARLIFQSRASLTTELPRLGEAKIGGSVVIVLTCDDLDAFYDRVSERTPFIKAPHVTFYGARECSLQDVNGYVLTFSGDADQDH